MKSATHQFALSKESIFKAGNYLDLRDKIDYLLSNNELRCSLSEKYQESAKKYRLEDCVKKFENEFLLKD